MDKFVSPLRYPGGKLKVVDYIKQVFEANDLFESGNLTQVQVSLLALAGKAKTKGLQSGHWRQIFREAGVKL